MFSLLYLHHYYCLLQSRVFLLTAPSCHLTPLWQENIQKKEDKLCDEFIQCHIRHKKNTKKEKRVRFKTFSVWVCNPHSIQIASVQWVSKRAEKGGKGSTEVTMHLLGFLLAGYRKLWEYPVNTLMSFQYIIEILRNSNKKNNLFKLLQIRWHQKPGGSFF